MKQLLTCLAISFVSASLLQAAAPEKLDLQAGNHVAIIGNTFADRMQHDAYLESLIEKAYPQYNLTFRNLGFAGDELTVRLRSQDFGSPDEWLAKVKADVVLAFFGFNESFGGTEGLPKFKADLAAFIVATKKQQYNGVSSPKLVIFSPIAMEKINDPNMPDPTADNANIKLYTAAMAEVAAANDVQFVDLYTPSLAAYTDAKTPLTINGIHLTEAGYKVIAPAMFKGLFGAAAPAIDASVENIRKAVVDKNETWFSRYRTVDGYNVYGGRSIKAYQPGKGGSIDNRAPAAPYVSNFQVMQQEMSVRDVMTANRDKKVWSVAQGLDFTIDDSNVPAVRTVETNHPGTLPGGFHAFLSGEEAIKHMTVPKGVKVNLWASEEQFKDLIKPVQMMWDTKGRLWVCAWRTYPEREPLDKKGDCVLILEDTKGTGHADKCTTFIGGLNCPTGFQFFKDGILLMQAPDLWYVPIVHNADGTDTAGTPERVINGMGDADSHHTTNSMVLDPGGATYMSDGVFHRTQVETALGKVQNEDGCIYRYEPLTGKFERYIAYGFANPHGRVFDYWGTDLITDATGNANYYGPAFSGHIDYPAKHPGVQEWWKRPSRPCPGTGMISSRAWPDDFNGNFLNCNVIGFQGIFRVKVSEDGSGLKGETLESLVSVSPQDNENFRPCGVNTGPDGALYFGDWSNSIIGHLQHHLRDPNRDHVHGRIYRMTYEGKTLPPKKIDGQPIAALLDLLKEPENDVRNLAKIELGKHDSKEVIAAVNAWAAALDKNDKDYAHNLTEALWVHQWHNVVDVELLKTVLRLPDFHARAAATRVLCYWRDRVPEAIALLKVQAGDESPRVRLEAVRAASFFDGKDAFPAMGVATEGIKKPADYFLSYTFKETMKQLQGITKDKSLPTDPDALAYVLEHMSDSDLLHTPVSEQVLEVRAERRSLDINERFKAIQALAKLHKATPEAELVTVLQKLDAKGNGLGAEDLGKALGSVDSDVLAKSRPALVALAENGTQAGVRRVAWAAVITADNKPETTWADAKTDAARQALADSIGVLYDPGLREQFQPILTAALADGKTAGGVRAAAIRALPLMGPLNAKANFALIAGFLEKGTDRVPAARAMMQLPRDSWDKTAAAPIAKSILAWAKTVPTGDRTGQDFIETTQAGSEIAGLLPPAEGSAIRKELRGLGVSVFVIKTVREQMRYDTTRIVVEAGKPFEVIMENLDFMPHNICFVDPGQRQSVAVSVEKMRPDQLDKEGRAYMPAKDKGILAASKLVEAGDKARIEMKGIRKPGEYEYVCTFPGHWNMMYGTLVVTKDVDAYLAAHPNAPEQPKVDPNAMKNMKH